MALAIGLAACGSAPVVHAPAFARGDLVLVGGGPKPEPAIARFVALAGGPEARIVVLPLASGDSRPAGADYVALFGRHGVRDVTVIQLDDRRDASRHRSVAALDRATGVWFSGGDQRRIAARVVDTPVHAALHALRARGGVVGGTSAGTACQSGVMLTGDGDDRVIRAGETRTTRGLDLVAGVILDTHFVRRHRERRLIGAVLDHPDRLGIGVDEGTAVWLRADGTLTAIGEGEVLIYDARGARWPADPRSAPDAVEGLRTHVLRDGDVFDLGRREVRR